eukprot:5455781-Lingulodinium_polyedra.AAC.1
MRVPLGEGVDERPDDVEQPGAAEEDNLVGEYGLVLDVAGSAHTRGRTTPSLHRGGDPDGMLWPPGHHRSPAETPCHLNAAFANPR